MMYPSALFSVWIVFDVVESSWSGKRGRDPYLLIWGLFVDYVGTVRGEGQGEDSGLGSCMWFCSWSGVEGQVGCVRV